MRISTGAIFRQAVEQMNQQQVDLARIQEQVASGQRLSTAADDPAAYSQALNIENSLGNLERLADNAGLSSQRLSILEDTLSELNGDLQRVRDLAVQANSGTLDADQRKYLQTEIDQILSSVMQLANRRDSTGNYMFAGNDQAGAPPFTQSGGTITYSGDQGLRKLEVAPNQFVTQNITGAELFQRIPTGADQFRVRENPGATGGAVLKSAALVTPGSWDGGPYQLSFTAANTYEVRDAGNNLISSGAYTPGDSIDVQGVRIEIDGVPATGDGFTVETGQRQDIFTTLSNFSEALGNPDGGARISNSVYQTLEDLDQAIDHLNNQRAVVGTGLSTADKALDTHDALSLQYKSTLSQIKDLDYAAASAELAQQLTALQAAQAAFVKVQGLSLFNYIR